MGKATLVDGAFHDVDSSVLAFEIAGRGCCREGLRKGKVRLMEPMGQVDVTTPEDYMGDVIGDINSRRGLVGDLGERGNAKTIRASVPLANMFQYVSTLRSISEVDFTHKKQSGGSGQYARCKVQFEPLDGEESADFVFASEIKGGAVPKEYIPGVQKGIEDVLKTGVLAGYPVLGMKATLVDGAFHDVDSSVLAFEIAGRGCCREGLRKGKV